MSTSAPNNPTQKTESTESVEPSKPVFRTQGKREVPSPPACLFYFAGRSLAGRFLAGRRHQNPSPMTARQSIHGDCPGNGRNRVRCVPVKDHFSPPKQPTLEGCASKVTGHRVRPFRLTLSPLPGREQDRGDFPLTHGFDYLGSGTVKSSVKSSLPTIQ